MTVFYSYNAPEHTTATDGVGTEFERVRRNMLWLAGTGFYSASHTPGYLIPGCSISVAGTLPEFTSITATWQSTGDTLLFRLTPTWTSGAITAMTWEIDIGAGWEPIGGPQEVVPVQDVAPFYDAKKPDPRLRSDIEMDAIKENGLVAIAVAAIQKISDTGATVDWMLPGFTTEATVGANMQSIKLMDSAGPGNTPSFFNEIEYKATRNVPAIYRTLYRGKEIGGTTVLQHTHSLSYDGNGRLESVDVIAPQ